MKFKIDKEAFSKAIQTLTGSVSGPSNMEISELVKIQVSPDSPTLTLFYSNGSIASWTDVVCKEMTDPMDVCLPLKQLMSITRAFEGDLEFKFGDKRAAVSYHKSKMQIPFKSARDYPPLETLNIQEGSEVFRIWVPPSSLLTGLQKALLAMAKTNSGRWHLNGLKITITDKTMNIYSCDGFQMSKVSIDEVTVLKDECSSEILVPGSAIPGLINLLKWVTKKKEGTNKIVLDLSDKKIRVITDVVTTETLVTSVIALASGKFPDVDAVLNGPTEFSWSGRVEDIRDAVFRALNFSTDNGYCEFMLSPEGALFLETKDPNLGECNEELEVAVTGLNDSPYRFAFNGKIFASAIENAGSDIEVKMNYEKRKPIFVDYEVDGIRFRYLLMRMIDLREDR